MQRDFTFHGGNAEFAKYKGTETIIHGPAETGKTISALWKLHLCALKYDKASIVIARKTLSSTYATVLQTFRHKVLRDPKAWGIRQFGGAKPEWFDYPGGARIWITGLDKSSKVLSAEHDVIYVNQAEELELDDWEILTTRATGRAGNMPYAQTIGDANPAWPTHWMYTRDGLRLFESKHVDNPDLYQNGELTAQGEITMSILRRLTGIRRTRLLEGLPAQAEGAIYTEYSETSHRRYESDAPDYYPRYMAGVDWGYRNPGALGLVGITGDGEMWLVAQYYATGRRDDWWLEKAKALNAEFNHNIEVFVCDPSEPAYIDKFKEAGLNAIGGNNAVLPGINAVKKRLAEDSLFFVRGSLREPDQELIVSKRPHCIEDEFPAYVWATTAKEQPVKEDDHGMDWLRYLVLHVDGEGPKQPARIY